jgi:hypothetical protein
MAVDAKTGQAIYPGVPGVGLNNVGSYQSSGAPWITGSMLRAEELSGSIRTYKFPRVARSITIQAVPNSSYLYGGKNNTDPVLFFFGEPKTIAGAVRAGDNAFDVNGASPKFTAAATAPPTQYSQAHLYSVQYMSGSNSSGGSFTTNIKTDHINIVASGIVDGAAKAVTASYQIFVELTNIPAERMPSNYISGSGVNTL